MNYIKASKKHKLGNIISGFCGILDGMILIISLGNYSATIQLNWSILRKSKNILIDEH